MLQGIRRRLTFSNVVALLALFFALGSSSFAEPVRDGALRLIKGKQLASNAVKSRHVADGSLTSADVRRNTLRARDLRAGVAATDVLGTARSSRGARSSAIRGAPVRASQTNFGICNTLGQVVLFGGNFAPDGTVAARGQVLPIGGYAALYDLYGTTFGGDGVRDFALPDLSGAEPKGQGQGPVGYFVCLDGEFPNRP